MKKRENGRESVELVILKKTKVKEIKNRERNKEL